MPEIEVNGVRLHYEVEGEGEPLVLVHGSWVDSSSWAGVVPGLARSYRVLVYDRRGHSRSERPDAPGSIDEDGDDLAALLEALDLAPAHVVTNSWGGNIALRLAIRRPDLCRSLTCHEPPLWTLLDEPGSAELVERDREKLEDVRTRLAAEDYEGAARHFVNEIAIGPGAWENELPPEVREVFVRNAPTFLDELEDPNQMSIDTEALRDLGVPVHLTGGTLSPSTFASVIERLAAILPAASRETIEGAGHVPHLTSPEEYVRITERALREMGSR